MWLTNEVEEGLVNRHNGNRCIMAEVSHKFAWHMIRCRSLEWYQELTTYFLCEIFMTYELACCFPSYYHHQNIYIACLRIFTLTELKLQDIPSVFGVILYAFLLGVHLLCIFTSQSSRVNHSDYIR